MENVAYLNTTSSNYSSTTGDVNWYQNFDTQNCAPYYPYQYYPTITWYWSDPKISEQLTAIRELLEKLLKAQKKAAPKKTAPKKSPAKKPTPKAPKKK